MLLNVDYDLCVLVCGGRDYNNYVIVDATLTQLDESFNIHTIVHGDARGADRMGERWARANKVPFEAYPAKWELHGKGAGPIRNQQMLDEEHIDLVVAFPGGSGTADMIKRALENGVAVVNVDETGKLHWLSPLPEREGLLEC